MKTKNWLLASSALALLATAGEAQARNLYISVFGGANFLSDSSGVVTTENWFGGESAETTFSFHSDADTGFVLGGVVGTHLDKWVKGLSAEVEVSYRRNDVGGTWLALSDGGEGPSFTSYGTIDANESTFAIMANLWYEIDCGWKARPYVGGGAGWGRAHADGVFRTTDNSTTLSFDIQNNGFAYQLGAGFNYDVQPGVAVGLGYRYFNGPNLAFDYFQGKQEFKLDNDSHSVLVNLTIDIN